MLLLKKHLVELVRTGKKRQTIRFWSHPILRAGQVSYTPGLGRMKILSVEELSSLQALTHDDALADGFAGLPELLAELHRNYPTVPAGKRLFRIRFQWPLEQPPADAEHSRSPDKVAGKRRTAANQRLPRQPAPVEKAIPANAAPSPRLQTSAIAPAPSADDDASTDEKARFKAAILSRLAHLAASTPTQQPRK